MRIVLHAGLHKSGTTAVQHAWRTAWAGTPRSGPVVWPVRGQGRVPGHHWLVWPLLAAFTEQRSPDLVGAHLRSGRLGDLAAEVADAAARGARTMVVSAEDLDRVADVDVPGLAAALGGHDTTLLLTVTDPVHRWCSGWQELVKHGLGDYPREAEPLVLDFASLRPGRLAELARLLPARRTVMRLVDPAREHDLPRDLAALVGLPDPGPTAPAARNASLGPDVEVLRRLNAADLALGTSRDGREALARLRGDGFTTAEVPGLAEHYALPAVLPGTAAAEQAWLTGDDDGSDSPDGPEVADPHDLLAGWGTTAVPGWYDAVSRREAVLPRLPGLDDPPSPAELLWRVRQERHHLRRLLERRTP